MQLLNVSASSKAAETALSITKKGGNVLIFGLASADAYLKLISAIIFS